MRTNTLVTLDGDLEVRFLSYGPADPLLDMPPMVGVVFTDGTEDIELHMSELTAERICSAFQEFLFERAAQSTHAHAPLPEGGS